MPSYPGWRAIMPSPPCPLPRLCAPCARWHTRRSPARRRCWALAIRCSRGKARVLAFATHGLLVGEVTGLTQPALVLTPPATPSAEDDGLLSLDDILELKLPHTDWVVLSACHTAAGDGSGEGLSGLARAFF